MGYVLETKSILQLIERKNDQPFQVLADCPAFEHPEAIVVQSGALAERLSLEMFLGFLLAFGDVDAMKLVWQVFFENDEQHTGCGHGRAVELEDYVVCGYC